MAKIMIKSPFLINPPIALSPDIVPPTFSSQDLNHGPRRKPEPLQPEPEPAGKAVEDACNDGEGRGIRCVLMRLKHVVYIGMNICI